MNQVIILPEAEGDLAQAYQWYEKQVVGLGSEFLLCVDTRTSKQLKTQNQELKTASSVFCSLSSVFCSLSSAFCGKNKHRKLVDKQTHV